MSKKLKISKGHNLRLAGEVDRPDEAHAVVAARVAVSPTDYRGFSPKLMVREGESVKAGQPLLHDKMSEQVVLVSPIAGIIESVVRGERRRIERVVVKCTASNEHVTFDTKSQTVKDLLLQSGLWAMMRQRPYDIVPRVDAEPRDVFVTAFDSSPLAVAMPLAGLEKELEAGVKALASLTRGKVYVSTRPGQCAPIAGAEIIEVKGPHPAGNAGVQCANIAPVNKGDTVWTLSVETLVEIGRLMLTGHPSYVSHVAVCGPEVESPYVAVTPIGAEIAPLLDGHVKANERHHRIISGNVLTGTAVDSDGFMRYPYTQLTVILEGDDCDEFMGWASMSLAKLSLTATFPSKLLRRRYSPDARVLGGERAMIMSCRYDKYLPMDILPEYLIKAIMARDIEKMEALGIYEVAPEDFALAEFADPSKLELQRIVTEGLDWLRKELE